MASWSWSAGNAWWDASWSGSAEASPSSPWDSWSGSAEAAGPRRISGAGPSQRERNTRKLFLNYVRGRQRHLEKDVASNQPQCQSML
eukprot:513680-Amphidinium_carterae.1